MPTMPFMRFIGSRSPRAHVAVACSLVLPEPSRPAAVRVPPDQVLYRPAGGRAMVLGPVELDAARDPRTQQAHQRGLDHVLAVEEIVVVGLVLADVNATADFRQYHQANVLILDEDAPI